MIAKAIANVPLGANTPYFESVIFNNLSRNFLDCGPSVIKLFFSGVFINSNSFELMKGLTWLILYFILYALKSICNFNISLNNLAPCFKTLVLVSPYFLGK